MAGKRNHGLADALPQATQHHVDRINKCSAHDCPLPGTITTESNAPVCCVHYLANKTGWPKATAVILHHIDLFDAARKAQTIGLPLGMSKEAATKLADAAAQAGLAFSDEQRNQYRIARMKLVAAGHIVEASITSKAVQASLTAKVRVDDPSRSDSERAFESMLESLSMR